MLLIGTVFLWTLAGTTTFVPRGVLGDLAQAHGLELQLIFLFFIGGLGVKAALISLHAWLPIAKVAPAR